MCELTTELSNVMSALNGAAAWAAAGATSAAVGSAHAVAPRVRRDDGIGAAPPLLRLEVPGSQSWVVVLQQPRRCWFPWVLVSVWCGYGEHAVCPRVKGTPRFAEGRAFGPVLTHSP